VVTIGMSEGASSMMCTERGVGAVSGGEVLGGLASSLIFLKIHSL
jgi:hypothetical protein